MTLTNTDLRRICEAATPGEWEAVLELAPDLDRYSHSIYSGGYKGLLIGRVSQNGAHEPDATFIATCNPSLVLAMLDEIDAMKVEIEKINKDHEHTSLMLGAKLAENTALKALVDAKGRAVELAAELDAENTALKAEVERMRGALKALVDMNDTYSPFGGEIARDRIEKTWDRARQALGASDE